MFKLIKPYTYLQAAIVLCALAACASQNRFVGKWSGDSTFSFGRVNILCDFTPAYVQCKWSDAIKASNGGTYTVKSPTEAVSETASYDFNLQPDGSMTFNNGAITMTLHRVTTP